MYKLLRVLIVAIAVAAVMMFMKNAQRPKTIGVTSGRLSELPDTPNAVSTQTSDERKRVAPLSFKETKEESLSAIKLAVSSYGGGEIVEERDDYLYVVFTTGKMKFKDDVEFYFDEENEIIHFRSASRVGYSDMGLNAERYAALSEMYLKE